MLFFSLHLYLLKCNLFCLFTAVYDVTIGYKPSCPTFFDNASGVNPSEVHMHVQRIPLDNIPTSEDEVTTWLMNRFHLKDQLLSEFDSQGHFPREGSEGDLSTLECLLNFVAVSIMTVIFTYLTIFSSIWFKIYVISVCAYLTAATIYNFRPSPLFSLVKGLFKHKSS